MAHSIARRSSAPFWLIAGCLCSLHHRSFVSNEQLWLRVAEQPPYIGEINDMPVVFAALLLQYKKRILAEWACMHTLLVDKGVTCVSWSRQLSGQLSGIASSSH